MLPWPRSSVLYSAWRKLEALRHLRGIELGITGALHVLVVGIAALAFRWQSPAAQHPDILPAPLDFALHAPDTPHDRPKAGLVAPVPMVPQTPPQLAAKAPAPQADIVEDTPAPADRGGQTDTLAQDALSWRHAIMARLEARRDYPRAALRQGWQGSGAVSFRLERGGRLLDLAIAETTGRPALDTAAAAIVRAAAPFPAIPDALPDEMVLTLQVDFLIARSGDRSNHYAGIAP